MTAIPLSLHRFVAFAMCSRPNHLPSDFSTSGSAWSTPKFAPTKFAFARRDAYSSSNGCGWQYVQNLTLFGYLLAIIALRTSFEWVIGILNSLSAVCISLIPIATSWSISSITSAIFLVLKPFPFAVGSMQYEHDIPQPLLVLK